MMMNSNHARSYNDYRTVKQPDYQPTPQPRVKVRVKKAGWITKGEKIIYSIVGIFFILVGYYLVSFASTTDTINRDIQSIEEQINEQRIVNDQLQIQVEKLSEPSRITNIARENGLKISSDIKQAESYQN